MSFPNIDTRRLLLRELAKSDTPALLALYDDREHMQWYGIEPFPDLAAAECRIRDMPLTRIEAPTHSNDIRSLALLRRLGFTLEGQLRQAARWDDRYHDMLKFSLICVE